MDFISFHAYDDDPLVVVDRIESVANTVASTTNYAGIELVLSEWGPDLETTSPGPSFAVPGDSLVLAIF